MDIFTELTEAANEAVEKARMHGEEVPGSFSICLETREIVRLTPEEELERDQELLNRYGLEEWPEDTGTMSYWTPEEMALQDKRKEMNKVMAQKRTGGCIKIGPGNYEYRSYQIRRQTAAASWEIMDPIQGHKVMNSNTKRSAMEKIDDILLRYV